MPKVTQLEGPEIERNSSHLIFDLHTVCLGPQKTSSVGLAASQESASEHTREPQQRGKELVSQMTDFDIWMGRTGSPHTLAQLGDSPSPWG